MPGARTGLKNLWVNALAVVTDAQPKLPRVVTDFHFDSCSLRMLESVAYGLTRNTIDVIPNNRREVTRCAFDIHPELGRVRVALICEFRSEHADRARKVAHLNSRRAQSVHCIATLCDRLPGLLDGSRQYLLSFVRAIPNHVGPAMQFQQHCLKALQQCVVQFPRDARPLGQPFFKTNLEQLSQLTHTQAVYE